MVSPSGFPTSYRYYLNIAGPNKTPIFIYPGDKTYEAATKPVSPFDNHVIEFQKPVGCSGTPTNPGACQSQYGASISCADVDNDGDTGEIHSIFCHCFC